LVGKDFEDAYSLQIKEMILALELEKNVFLYGSKQEVNTILEQSAIAILTSQSEGMPMALLEYGRRRKAVVVTSVGEIPALIQNGENGFLVSSQDKDQFYKALVRLIEEESLRANLGNALYESVLQQYFEETVLKYYLNWVKTI
jgi:glycosyltransferase involved in cell wall biosynthesis